ncbi:hypothetical protein MYCTH_2113210 [Thermothelomyces thermophilus ATCC 42464]|uniref:F-box domain-containing protein n=1 Tax=Thermothelomyces thermophilus (strain ATCC 42464 / BCRC 31852 / DSM 1799) TaxID=573729 RepID=G2QNP8_THET4|nr:uncharacterized protein MYCTH_2113210 [Thermothelomyces thermophilus ATCC 42464]AEO61272.1 hypothetical protein MYCTH_2113210 [Thermothelomyces thermophilus ATCC 42464]
MAPTHGMVERPLPANPARLSVTQSTRTGLDTAGDTTVPSPASNTIGGITPHAGIDVSVKLAGDDSRSQPPASPKPCPRHLLTLPPEILLMILQALDFADIVRLRETCMQLRALASPQQVRVLFGPDRLHSQPL